MAAFIPESKLFQQLKDTEQKMDASLARKKCQVEETVREPKRTPATLRLYVFNSHAHQESGETSKEPPSWTLFLYGKLIRPKQEKKTDDGNPTDQKVEEDEDEDEPKLSQMLREVHVQLDETLFPGEKGKAVWKAGEDKKPIECFEIKRIGSKETKARITLHLDQVPPRFKLSDPLAELLGIRVDTKPNIIAALWQYIKTNQCQMRNEPQVIKCDERLKQVFGKQERMGFTKLASALQEHLLPEPPVAFDYTIKVNGPSPTHPDVYDLYIDAPSSSRGYEEFLRSVNSDKVVEQCEREISALASRVDEHKRRRAFFLGFSHSPVDFINSLIASQSRDLKVMKSSEAQNYAKLGGRAEFYKLPWAQDAVVKYLQRRLAAGAIES